MCVALQSVMDEVKWNVASRRGTDVSASMRLWPCFERRRHMGGGGGGDCSDAFAVRPK